MNRVEAQTAIRIDARSKSVRELLDGVKYGIDYYQREYKWETKQIVELIEDLEAKFLDSFDPDHPRSAVAHYTHYFLGSIVVSNRDGQKFLIDGQQRLTSLTLLLIYLHNLQAGRSSAVSVENLIYSETYGTRSFNLEVPERVRSIEALFSGQALDTPDQPESVRNIIARYRDIDDHFPETLKDQALPYFVDWLKENVDLVEITAFSDDEAYTIFETMNDRGLSLSPTDMLKGYLLANIAEPKQKADANARWKGRLLELNDLGKEEDADFFKAWLRAKYADSIRERKKGAHNRDFDIIGTTFHKWVRDNHETRIHLKHSEDFFDFVMHRFDQFAQYYVLARKAARTLTPGFESIYYNAHNNFTLQYPLMLAPLRLDDDPKVAERKMRVVAAYLDIFIVRRAVNFRTLDYSSVVYTMFLLMKEIRDLPLQELAGVLRKRLDEMEETIAGGMAQFYLNMWSKRYIHHILARMTSHIEEECGIPTSFETYISRDIKKPFEIEHIWADRYDRHADEFPSESEFMQYRNRIGDLILLPRGVNQSLGDGIYEHKLKHYYAQNLLARALNEQCYENNPSFLSYVERSGLPFRPYPHFSKADVDAHQQLYQAICGHIWSPTRLDREVAG